MFRSIWRALRGDYDGRFFAWFLGEIGKSIPRRGECMGCRRKIPPDDLECDGCWEQRQ